MYRLIGKKEGELLTITEEELKHLKVLRLSVSNRVEVNDLEGNIYEGEILQIDKRRALVKPIKKLEIIQEELNIQLFLCMPNQLSKVDDLIEPISQLGVKILTPVLSRRSAVKQKDVQKKIDKWQRIALQSIKQCKRQFPLTIENPIEIHKIKVNDGLKLVFYEKEKENTLKSLEVKQEREVSILIGPEGGLEEEEVNLLKKEGFIPLSLGRMVLKMETAVIVAICQAKFKLT